VQPSAFNASFDPNRGRRPPNMTGATRAYLMALAATLVAVTSACGSSSSSKSSVTPATAMPAGTSTTPASAAAASSAVDLSKVTLQVGEEEKNVVTLLTQAGLQNTPYKIVYSEWPTSAAELQGLTAGAADIGGAAAAPTINAIAAGAPIQAAVAELSNQATGAAILVPKNSPIQTVAQLKGKEVSPTTKGSIGEYVLLANLNKVGLGPSDIKLDFLQPTDARAAFASGDIAAWSTWDPYLATAEIEDGARVLADGAGLNASLGFLDVTDSALNNPGKHAAIQDLINRMDAAALWEQAHLSTASQTYSKLYSTPLNIASVVEGRGIETLQVNSSQIQSDFQTIADLYAKDGVISKDVQVGPSLNHTFTVDPSAAPTPS
jgi:sulfonate transport system substrate-binding protein